MRWITYLGDAWVTVGVGVVLAVLGSPRLGGEILVAVTLSHVGVQVLKRAVARPRPCDAMGRPLALIDLPDPFSFPSGHATAAMAVSATLSLHQPLLAPALLPLAGLVAASRVRLRVHHLSDVVAGAALGLAGALVATTLL